MRADVRGRVGADEAPERERENALLKMLLTKEQMLESRAELGDAAAQRVLGEMLLVKEPERARATVEWCELPRAFQCLAGP